jgi:CheY-like chemotaxis protein
MNLVVNARDAMPDGGQIIVRTSDVWLEEFSKTGLAAGPYVLLEVCDTGVGMDAATRERVFEPFFTTKDVGRGTGLGLSTVYGIVRQMGGAVDLESEVDRGTTFRLYFPETSPAARSPRLVPSVGRRADETLLLVEDDDAVRAYLSQVLESHGYRVLAAGHPRAAQSILESFRHRIHLVISDVVMPETTGPELVPLLGRRRPGPAALYISGYSDMRFEGGGDLVKPHELLREPFSSTELLSRIRQILSAA